MQNCMLGALEAAGSEVGLRGSLVVVEDSSRGWALRAGSGYLQDTAMDQAGDRISGSETWFFQCLRASYLPSLSLSFSIYNLGTTTPFVS